jgi:hypothetical protein
MMQAASETLTFGNLITICTQNMKQKKRHPSIFVLD